MVVKAVRYLIMLALLLAVITMIFSGVKINSCMSTAIQKLQSAESFLVLERDQVCKDNLNHFKDMQACISSAENENPIAMQMGNLMALYPAKVGIENAIAKHNKSCPYYPANIYQP